MRKIAWLLILAFCLSACGDRLPSPKTAHHLLQKNFQKYGKKYKDSDFGKQGLDRVEIGEIQEIQKGFASVEGFAFLKEGRVYKVRATLQKKPFGWRFLSWETEGVR